MADPDSLRTALCFGEPKDAVESVRAQLRKAIRRTGVQNLARMRGVSTDDVMQDLTTAAFMRAKRYGCGRRRDDPIRYFPSWLATHARFSVLDEVRAKERRLRAPERRPAPPEPPALDEDAAQEIACAMAAVARDKDAHAEYARAHLELLDTGVAFARLSRKRLKAMLRVVSDVLAVKSDSAFDTGLHRFRKRLVAVLEEHRGER